MTLAQPRRRAFIGNRKPHTSFHSGRKKYHNGKAVGSEELDDTSGIGKYKSKRQGSKVEIFEERGIRDCGSNQNSRHMPEAEIYSSSDENEKYVPADKVYSELLKTFLSEAPKSKRRKTSHSSYIEQQKNKQATSEISGNIDDVQEPEDDPSAEIDNFDEEDEEVITNVSDPFISHFCDSIVNDKIQLLQSIEANDYHVQKVDISDTARAIVCVPKHGECFFEVLPLARPERLALKKSLSSRFLEQKTEFGTLEGYLASFIFNYQDLLFCARTPSNSDTLRRMVCLHSVNHIYKTRTRVIKNNAKVAQDQWSLELDLRDQGFTRPKVLFLLPTRQSCVRMVNMIISLCEPEQQENRKRFDDSYVEISTNSMADRSDEFKELFEGNNDDMFQIGLKFTRKTIKFFSQFYNSDIIFASPLGLKMTINGAGKKKGDYDFLSSIELVIVDQVDALLMQNWEHLENIFDHINLQPKETHGCDFSRVRNWYLDNNAIYFRQTIALTAFNTPELNTLFFNKSKNWAGKIKINPSYAGLIDDLGFKVKQSFSRLDSASFATDPDVRFTYFTSAIIPSLTRHLKETQGTLIFIPSYLDFVRLRNYFSMSQATSELSFGSISEYTPIRDAARARSHFFTGRHKVLIYTERAHHFRRYQIRGVRRIIMYGLPDNPIFYKEIVGGYLARSFKEGELMHEDGNLRVIYSKWDILKLERIVGTARIQKMTREKGDTFEFL